ncbi:copper resistance CopC family protein [Saccharopolyspora sp. SCSIO 74807]|uniref:copper resistance CopC family protein n=1 Tax=Saccharopolyspora sp. SCSIO 74807 TaxID=3118084 RepID=UPI0030D18B22
MTVAVLMLVGALLAQPHAWAHAELTGSDPVGGATLQQPPAQARLTFSDPVNPQFVTVAVTDQDGGHPSLPAPAVENNQVVQPLPSLSNGGYTIAYRIVSADGHPVAGQIQFTISASTPPSTAAPGVNASPPPSATGTEEQSSGAWLLWAGGALVVILLIAGVVVSLRRLGREE